MPIPADPAQAIEGSLQLANLGLNMERLHTLAIALDDLLDGANERRGGPALHRMFEKHAKDGKGIKFRSQGLHWEYRHSPTWYMSSVSSWILVEIWRNLLRIFGESTVCCEGLEGLDNQCLPAHNSMFLDQEGRDATSTQDIFKHLQGIIEKLRNDPSHRNSWGVNAEIMDTLLDVLQTMLDGERTDITWNAQVRVPSIQDVYWLQYQKTTSYSLHLPLELARLMADPHGPSLIKHYLRDLATSFGIAFQIIDDCLIGVGDEVAGKPVLQDLAQGSWTTVTVWVYEHLTDDHARAHWVALLRECATSPEAQQRALQIICDSDALSACHELAMMHSQTCYTAIEGLAKLGCDTSLLKYLVQRGLGWMDDARSPVGETVQPTS